MPIVLVIGASLCFILGLRSWTKPNSLSYKRLVNSKRNFTEAIHTWEGKREKGKGKREKGKGKREKGKGKREKGEGRREK